MTVLWLNRSEIDIDPRDGGEWRIFIPRWAEVLTAASAFAASMMKASYGPSFTRSVMLCGRMDFWDREGN